MLSPVPAVSSVSGVTSLKPATVGVETLIALIASMPDAEVALSRAASASVEGKLNMLLIAARERMIDSLFAVVDAVSESLNLPQEQGETNSAYALRLADAVETLSKPQLAALQQQLTARGQTLPLQLIAAALKDPTGQQAAQVVAYLEVVRYKDRDLATKAVVSSYGQNAGAAEEETATAEQSTQAQAKPAALPDMPVTVAANSNVAAQSAPIARQPDAQPTATALVAAEVEVAMAASVEEAVANPVATETRATGTIATEAGSEPVVPQSLQQAATDAFADKPQTAVAKPASADETPAPVAAALEERLKAVVKLAIDAAGPELLVIMADSERLSEAVVAQALIADLLDDQDLSAAQAPAEAPEEMQGGPLPSQSQPAAGLSLETGVQDAPSIVRLFVPAATAPAASLTPADVPLPAQPPVPLGVPFAIAQYLPVEEPKTDVHKLAVDRVDPIDGEGKGKGGNSQRQSADGDDQEQNEADAEAVAEAQAVETTDELPIEAAAQRRALPERSSALALPRQQQAASPAFDLYQRMADWQ